MSNERKEGLYNALSKKGYKFNGYEGFERAMKDANVASKLYKSATSKGFKFDPFDKWYEEFGPEGNAEPNAVMTPDKEIDKGFKPTMIEPKKDTTDYSKLDGRYSDAVLNPKKQTYNTSNVNNSYDVASPMKPAYEQTSSPMQQQKEEEPIIAAPVYDKPNFDAIANDPYGFKAKQQQRLTNANAEGLYQAGERIAQERERIAFNNLYDGINKNLEEEKARYTEAASGRNEQRSGIQFGGSITGYTPTSAYQERETMPLSKAMDYASSQLNEEKVREYFDKQGINFDNLSEEQKNSELSRLAQNIAGKVYEEYKESVKTESDAGALVGSITDSLTAKLAMLMAGGDYMEMRAKSDARQEYLDRDDTSKWTKFGAKAIPFVTDMFLMRKLGIGAGPAGRLTNWMVTRGMQKLGYLGAEVGTNVFAQNAGQVSSNWMVNFLVRNAASIGGGTVSMGNYNLANTLVGNKLSTGNYTGEGGWNFAGQVLGDYGRGTLFSLFGGAIGRASGEKVQNTVLKGIGSKPLAGALGIGTEYAVETGYMTTENILEQAHKEGLTFDFKDVDYLGSFAESAAYALAFKASHYAEHSKDLTARMNGKMANDLHLKWTKDNSESLRMRGKGYHILKILEGEKINVDGKRVKLKNNGDIVYSQQDAEVWDKQLKDEFVDIMRDNDIPNDIKRKLEFVFRNNIVAAGRSLDKDGKVINTMDNEDAVLGIGIGTSYGKPAVKGYDINGKVLYEKSFESKEEAEKYAKAQTAIVEKNSLDRLQAVAGEEGVKKAKNSINGVSSITIDKALETPYEKRTKEQQAYVDGYLNELTHVFQSPQERAIEKAADDNGNTTVGENKYGEQVYLKKDDDGNTIAIDMETGEPRMAGKDEYAEVATVPAEKIFESMDNAAEDAAVEASKTPEQKAQEEAAALAQQNADNNAAIEQQKQEQAKEQQRRHDEATGFVKEGDQLIPIESIGNVTENGFIAKDFDGVEHEVTDLNNYTEGEAFRANEAQVKATADAEAKAVAEEEKRKADIQANKDKLEESYQSNLKNLSEYSVDILEGKLSAAKSTLSTKETPLEKAYWSGRIKAIKELVSQKREAEKAAANNRKANGLANDPEVREALGITEGWGTSSNGRMMDMLYGKLHNIIGYTRQGRDFKHFKQEYDKILSLIDKLEKEGYGLDQSFYDNMVKTESVGYHSDKNNYKKFVEYANHETDGMFTDKVKNHFKKLSDAMMKAYPERLAERVDATKNNVSNEAQPEQPKTTRSGRRKKLSVKDSGLVRDDNSASYDEDTKNGLDLIGKILGTKIVVKDSVDGGKANASYENGVIEIEKGNPNPIKALFGHESMHRIREIDPEGYESIKQAMKSAIGDTKWKELIENTRDLYVEEDPNTGEKIDPHDDDYYEEEVVSDYSGDIFNNGELVDRMLLNMDTSTLGKLKKAARSIWFDITGDNRAMLVDSNLGSIDDRMGFKQSPITSMEFSSIENRIQTALDNAAKRYYVNEEIGKNAGKTEGTEVQTAEGKVESAVSNDGDTSAKKSIKAAFDGAGFESAQYDDDGNASPLTGENGDVIIRMGGKTFSGRTPITKEDLKKNPSSTLNIMLKDAAELGGIGAERADIILDKYANLLNTYLTKGLKENGGAAGMVDSWQWVGESVFKTVASNGDSQYSKSIDITRVCKKNEAVINSISELQQRLGYGITPGQIMDIYLETEKQGYQVPCPVCYVFSRYIRNGKYASSAINGMRKYGNHLKGGKDSWTVDQWLAEMDRLDAENEASKKELTKANEDVTTALDKIDKLGMDIMSGKLSEKEVAAKKQEIENLDKRYRAALDVISQQSLTNWIKSFAIQPKKGKWILRNDTSMPKDMKDFENNALDLRLTANTMTNYPAIQRLRKSGGSAAGKEITFASNNDLGEIIAGLGTNKPEEAKNWYKIAAEATTAKARTKALDEARKQMANAIKFAQQQTLRGGQRMWSWSDNIERLSGDVAMNLMQMDMLGGALQSYSKQLEGIDLVSRMNGYVNGSLMGYGNGYHELTEADVEMRDGKPYLNHDIVMKQDGKHDMLTAQKGDPVYVDPDTGAMSVLAFDDVVGIQAFDKVDPTDGKKKDGLFAINKRADKAGNILVGMNDTHVKAAMNDERVYFIIPWHASGQSTHILRQMLGYLGVDVNNFKPLDYTDMQEEKDYGKETDGKMPEVPERLVKLWNEHKNESDWECGINGGIESGDGHGGLSKGQRHYRELRDAIFDGSIEKNASWRREVMKDKFLSQVYRKVHATVDGGVMTNGDKKYIYPYEYWDEGSTYETARVNADRYLEYTRRLGYKPKFSGRWKSGNPNEGNFVNENGYWKVLIDRRMYDTNGKFQDLDPVDASGFDGDLIDPAKTNDKYIVTKVADEEGVNRITDAVVKKETERTGTMPTVDYSQTMTSASDKYNEARQSKKAYEADIEKLQDKYDAAKEEHDAFKKQKAEEYGSKLWYTKVFSGRDKVNPEDISRNKELYNNAEAIKKELDSLISKAELSDNTERYNKEQEFLDNAEQEFGTTESYNDAGYIMPNGKMLDFGEGYGQGRTLDHRNIKRLYEKLGMEVSLSEEQKAKTTPLRNTPSWLKNLREDRYSYLNDFRNRGAIRIIPEGNGLDMNVEPSAEQYKVIKDYARTTGGTMDIDFNDREGNVAHSVSYDEANPSRIVADIHRYYQEGIKPKGNARFSKKTEEARDKQFGLERGKDESWTEFAHRMEKSSSPVLEPARRGATNEETVTRYSKKMDDKTKSWLDSLRIDENNEENSDVVVVYRAMVLGDDGNLYPPMSNAGLGKTSSKGNATKTETQQRKEWAMSEEHPEVINDNGKVFILTDDGQQTQVAYNPYFHTSKTMLNDQFAAAWRRPRLVTVKCYVPKSELTDGYKAEFAKDGVGEMEWNEGPVSRQLSGDKKRRVILSRYCMIGDIVDINEYAKAVKDQVGEIGIPFNAVTPEQRDALVRAGVKIVEPVKNSMGKNGKNSPVWKAYEEWLNGGGDDPNGGKRYSIKGEFGAKNMDDYDGGNRMYNLGVAKDMMEKNEDALTIKMATGWEIGKDGKWRHEEQDFPYIDTSKNPKTIGEAYPSDHPLIVAYPQLKDIELDYSKVTGSAGSYKNADNKITISKEIWEDTNDKDYLRSVIQHETQHAIQHIEGFSKGGNNETMKIEYLKGMAETNPAEVSIINAFVGSFTWKMIEASSPKNLAKSLEYYKNIDAVKNNPEEVSMVDKAIDILRNSSNDELTRIIKNAKSINTKSNKFGKDGYNNLAGEVESRNVEKRINKTDEEKLASLLESTEDIPRSKQIVMFGEDENDMGSRYNKIQDQFSSSVEEDSLTGNKKEIYNVFSGNSDNVRIIVARNNGRDVNLLLTRGRETGIGTKHSLFKHYGEDGTERQGRISSEEIMMIDDVISNGEESKEGRRTVYTLENKGVRISVVTEERGSTELFINAYTNRKGLHPTASSTSATRDKTRAAEMTNLYSGGKDSDNLSNIQTSGENLNINSHRLSKKNEDQTKSENFKKRFGDWEKDPEHSSKAVDENGEPLLVYHGTNDGGYTTFRGDVHNSEAPDNTFWFSTNRKAAKAYAEKNSKGSMVYESYLSMKKPYIVDALGNDWDDITKVYEVTDEKNDVTKRFENYDEAKEFAKSVDSFVDSVETWTANDIARYAMEKGYDGVIIKNVKDGSYHLGDDYVVFSPEQIIVNDNQVTRYSKKNDQTKSDNFKKWFGDWEKDPKNASKVVDNEGKPMVVWHGGPVKINIFDKEMRGSYTGADGAKMGFFFTDNNKLADGFAEMSGLESKNLEQLDEVPDEKIKSAAFKYAKKNNGYNGVSNENDFREMIFGDYAVLYAKDKWNASIEDMTEEAFVKGCRDYLKDEVYRADKENIGEMKELYSDMGLNIGNTEAVYLDIKNPYVYEKPLDYADGVAEGTMSRIIREAKEKGHDGVIFRDVNEVINEESIRGQQLVVFEPEQIKSATENNGDFSRENPDIRYSRKSGRPMEASDTPRSEAQTRVQEMQDTIDRMMADQGWYTRPDLKMVTDNDNAEDIQRIVNDLTKFVGERLSPTMKSAMGVMQVKSLMSQIKKAANTQDLRHAVRQTQLLLNAMQMKVDAAEMEKTLSKELQKKNQKGMLEGKTVDNGIRLVMEDVKQTWGAMNDTDPATAKSSAAMLADLSVEEYETMQRINDALANGLTPDERDEDSLYFGIPTRRQAADIKETMEDKDVYEAVWKAAQQTLTDYHKTPEYRSAKAKQSLGHQLTQDDLDALAENNRLLDAMFAAEDAYIAKQREVANGMYKLNQSLKSLLEEGRDRRRQKVEAEKQHRSDMLQRLTDDFGGADVALRGELGNDSGRMVQKTTGSEDAGKLAEKVEDTAVSVSDALYMPLASLQFLLKNDRNHMSGDGKLYEYFFKSPDTGIVAAEHTEHEGLKSYGKELDDAVTRIFGDDFTSGALDKFETMGNTPFEKLTYEGKKPLGIVLPSIMTAKEANEWNARGRRNGGKSDYQEGDVYMEDNMTKGHGLYLWLTWQQTDGRMKLMKMGYDQASIDKLESALGQEMIDFGMWAADEFLPKLRRERYNPTYERIYGTSLAETPHYFPLKMDKDRLSPKGGIEEQQQVTMAASASTPNIIHRRTNTSPIDTKADAFDVLREYGEHMEHWNAFAEVVKDMNIIYGSPMAKEVLNANHKGGYKQLMEAFQVATKSYQSLAPDADNIVNKIASTWGKARINFRMYTALKQLSSYPAFATYAADPSYQMDLLTNLSGISKDNGNITGVVKWAMENMPMFERRVEGGSMGQEGMDAKGLLDGTPIVGKTMKGIEKYGMAANKFFDKFAIAAGAKAVYDLNMRRNLKAGMSQDEAHARAIIEAEIAFNESQQSSVNAFSSPTQKSSTALVRALMMFRNAAIGYGRKGVTGVNDMRKAATGSAVNADGSEMTGKDRMKAFLGGAANAFNYFGVLPMLWTMVSGNTASLVYDMLSGDTDEDEKKKLWQSMVLGATTDYSVFGTFGSSIANGYGINPFGFVADINKAVEKQNRSGEEFSGAGLAAEIIKSLADEGAFIPVTTETVTNIATGATDFVKDAIAHGDTWDKDMAIDFMVMLNMPKSDREAWAKRLYNKYGAVELAKGYEKAARVDSIDRKAAYLAKDYVAGKDKDFAKAMETFAKNKKEYGKEDTTEERKKELENDPVAGLADIYRDYESKILSALKANMKSGNAGGEAFGRGKNVKYAVSDENIDKWLNDMIKQYHERMDKQK